MEEGSGQLPERKRRLHARLYSNLAHAIHHSSHFHEFKFIPFPRIVSFQVGKGSVFCSFFRLTSEDPPVAREAGVHNAAEDGIVNT